MLNYEFISIEKDQRRHKQRMECLCRPRWACARKINRGKFSYQEILPCSIYIQAFFSFPILLLVLLLRKITKTITKESLFAFLLTCNSSTFSFPASHDRSDNDDSSLAQSNTVVHTLPLFTSGARNSCASLSTTSGIKILSKARDYTSLFLYYLYSWQRMFSIFFLLIFFCFTITAFIPHSIAVEGWWSIKRQWTIGPPTATCWDGRQRRAVRGRYWTSS